MSNVYCNRFNSMIRLYSKNQKEFAELIKLTPDVVTRMKQSEGMLMTHLVDIAKNIPSFNFNYLFYGDTPQTSLDKRKILALAQKIEKICSV